MKALPVRLIIKKFNASSLLSFDAFSSNNASSHPLVLPNAFTFVLHSFQYDSLPEKLNDFTEVIIFFLPSPLLVMFARLCLVLSFRFLSFFSQNITDLHSPLSLQSFNCFMLYYSLINVLKQLSDLVNKINTMFAIRSLSINFDAKLKLCEKLNNKINYSFHLYSFIVQNNKPSAITL